MLRRSKKKDQQQQQQHHQQQQQQHHHHSLHPGPGIEVYETTSSAQTSPSHRSLPSPQYGATPRASADLLSDAQQRKQAEHPTPLYQITSMPSSVAHSTSSEGTQLPRTSPSLGPARQAGIVPSSSSSVTSSTQHIGRSQSAFNFLLSKASKAKSSLGVTSLASPNLAAAPSSSSGNIIASNSMGSLVSSLHEDQHPAPAIAYPTSSSSRVPPSQPPPHPIGPYGNHALASAARSSSTDIRNVAMSRSFDSDVAGQVTTSPTKKGFFSRERRGTTAAAQAAAHSQARSGSCVGSRTSFFPGGPAGSGRGIGSANYTQFSKSQNELHSRAAEMFSPTSMTIDLPKVPVLPQSYQDERNTLRSPTFNTLSRSVEDLGQAHAGMLGAPRSPSPQPLSNGQGTLNHASSYAGGPNGTWGEQGVTAQTSWGRPFDVSTIKPNASAFHSRSRQSSHSSGLARAISPCGSRADSIPFSAASSSAPWPSQRGPSPTPEPSNQPNQSGHQRKHSKFGVHSDTFFSPGTSNSNGSSIPVSVRERKATSSSLASSFSLGNVAAGASNVMEKIRGAQQGGIVDRPSSSADSLRDGPPPSLAQCPLPPGAAYQGFLNRNGNVSLTLQQLGGGREKEKDVSKGWKPYRVVLKDASLHFYKPPNAVAEEVKALFPSGLVRHHAGETSTSSNVQKLDAEMLRQAGLGTQALLRATSSDGWTSSAGPSLSQPQGQMISRSISPSPSKKSTLKSMPRAIEEGSVPTIPTGVFVSWHRPGKHPDLALVNTRERPSHWPERIEGGSLAALVHEIVFASQQGPSDDSQDIARLIQTTLFSAIKRGQMVTDFIDELSEQAYFALKDRGELEAHVVSAIEARVGWCFDILASFHAEAIDAQAAEALNILVRNIGLDLDVGAILQGQESASSQRLPPTDWLQKSPEAPRPKLASLAAGHLSGSDLLDFEPPVIASQIQVFHVDRVRFYASPRPTVSALFADLGSPAGSSAALMSFGSAKPHFLTQLILYQVLESSDGAYTRPSSSVGPQARHRARLLRHWIAIASWSLSFGDLLSWTAIMAALCSRAISRLEHTWRLVAEGDRTLLGNSWALKLAKLNWNEYGDQPIHAAVKVGDITSRSPKPIDGKKPCCIPYLGDALTQAEDLYRKLIKPGDDTKHWLPMAPLAPHVARVYQVCQSWAQETAAHQPRLGPQNFVFVEKPVIEFQQLFQRLATNWESTDVSKPSLRSYIQASLACEARSLGTVDLSWRPPLPAALEAKAILPLVFPEIVPNLDLLDSKTLITRAASDDIRNISSGCNSRDSDANVRPAGHRYVRSPLSGAPLVRASLQSLTRTKTAASSGARCINTLQPFDKIVEWGPGRLIAEDETVFRIGSDLVLKATEDMPASLPSSPMTGKRFSQDFCSRGARPLSQISKRSSLPTSNRSSVVEAAIPLQVAVKTGTLERLVDVAVLGVGDLSVNLSDDANENLASQIAKRSRLSMDLSAYRLVFLTTFRTIVNPLMLFEFLRKRYMAAVNGGREMNAMPLAPNASRFPGWSLIDASARANYESVDWDFVARVRHGVIAMLHLWITRCTQDFVDDVQLFESVFAFAEQQVTLAETVDHELDVDCLRAAASLQETVALLRINALCANAKPLPDSAKPSRSRIVRLQKEGSIDFDAATSIDLVDHLECIARVYFGKITERDWLAATEVFDAQSADPLGWHLVKERSRPDEPQVSSMYKLLELLKCSSGTEGEPSSPGAPSSTIYEKLPAAIRDAWGAQSLLRGWIAIHIIEQHVGVQLRQARIEKLLDAIWLCRARMLNTRMEEGPGTPLAGDAPLQEATIGSFVENIIIASLTAPESRTFVRAWQGVCHARGGSGEGFEDLIPRPTSLPVLNQAASGAATPDIGWVLRSLAQAVSRKSSAAQADSTFIDFGRCQLVFDLIESTLAVRRRGGPIDPSDADLAAKRLPLMQEKLRKVHWDSRAFREDAAQEAATAPPLPRYTSWRAHRPLQGVLLQQSEKQQRDRNAYESLKAALDAAKVTATKSSAAFAVHETLAGKTSTSSASQTPNTGGSMGGAGGGNATLVIEKRSRRMTSLWRGATRFGASSDKVLSVAEPTHHLYHELLAATPTVQKPSLVINLADAEVSVWKNLQRSFTFHINSHDGQRVLLQATGQCELSEWLQHIEQTVREAASRASMSEARKFGGAGGGRHGKASPSFTPFFGLDLQTLVEREGRPVPLALQRMLAEIESRGLHEVGIYRISGSKVTIDALQQAFRTRPAETIDLQHGEFSDVHVLSNVVKLWLRELPEPVVPYAFYRPLILVETIADVDERLNFLREVIWKLPRAHFDLLKALCEHFARVVDEGEHNKMLTHNIGLIFGTSLLNPAPSPSAVAEGFGQLGQRANLVKLMVSYYDWIFDPEPEPEAEPEADREPEPETAASVAVPEDSRTREAPTALFVEAAVTAEGHGSETTTDQDQKASESADVFSVVVDAESGEPEDFGEHVEEMVDVHQIPTESQVIVKNRGVYDALSVADASRAGKALKRRELPKKDSRREELSIYADALDIDLGAASAAAALRSSLLPDDAMLDILRMIHASEEGEVAVRDADN